MIRTLINSDVCKDKISAAGLSLGYFDCWKTFSHLNTLRAQARTNEVKSMGAKFKVVRRVKENTRL